MSSHPLEFEMTDDQGRVFLVSFESESPTSNLLMGVIYRGLPLDTVYIRDYDSQLFWNIQDLMLSTASEFWKTEKIVA